MLTVDALPGQFLPGRQDSRLRSGHKTDVVFLGSLEDFLPPPGLANGNALSQGRLRHQLDRFLGAGFRRL